MRTTGPEAFDQYGRPVIHEERRSSRETLSTASGKVLYALAIAALRGVRMGLTRRSIRKILQHEDDPFAGTWKWLFDTDISLKEDGAVSIRNALRKIRENYPIIVLKDGTYIDVDALPREDGGVTPDVYALDESAIITWPCRARIVALLSTAIHEHPVHYKTLKHYIPDQHCSHIVPAALQESGARTPEPHSLSADIEFLARTRYLKINPTGRNDSRKPAMEVVQPAQLEDETVIEVGERAYWELTYLERLARHFVSARATEG